MKKKVFSLMMMLLLAFMGVAKAEVVEIGQGTSTTYQFPVNSLYNYSFTEMIYSVDEIGTAGTINSVAFHFNGGNVLDRTVVMYMKNVDRSGFASTADYEGVTSDDIVFTGTLTSEAVDGWVTLTLDTPFEYDGFGNLMIAFDDNTGSWSSRYFYYTTATNACLCYYSDTYNPEISELASYSGSKTTSSNRPNVQIDITPSGGGEGDRLHVKYMDGEEEIIDVLNLGVRPAGAWMEPFNFIMYTDGPAYTVNILDFTPTDGLFNVYGEELPFQVTRNHNVNLSMTTNGTEAGLIERQFVAITEGDRAAHVWPLTVELYAPEIPDVWEKACTEATTFPFVEVPAMAHSTFLHNDYTLPFPEIPEGYDAVYKLVFDVDQVLNASVTAGENGKVALYTQDFYGEGGPMADNYYTGPTIGGGGASGAAFEAFIGDETSTTTSTYFPFHSLWNYSIGENLFLASELAEAGVTTAPMTSLSWNVLSTTCSTPQNGISIWMANVDDAELTGTSHTTNGMTLVYTGENILPEVGWNEFVFNQGSFSWDGHSNVLILCQRLNGSWQGSISWQTHNPGFQAMTYDYDDYEVYDVTTQSYSMYTSSTNRANIIMKGGGRRNREVVVYDFEDQQIPADWNNTSAYPWTVVSENGSYCMKSSNGGVASSTSTISATFDLATDGTISFDALCMGEGTGTAWDKCIFILDGEQQFAYGAHVAGWNNYSYEVSAGSHLCTWTYSKDGSVNPNGDYFMVDNVTITTADAPAPGPGFEGISYGPVIEDAAIEAGTYYLVASSTYPGFEVTINAEPMPCPEVEGFAFNPTPADNEDGVEPASVTLRWNIPANATGWRLVFGSTYHPEPGHPQTVIYPEDGSFSTTLANSYTVRNLWNNTNYFWRVEFNNSGSCPEGVSSPVWGFTTHLNIPQNLTAVDYTVFDDENIVLNWNAVADRTYRMYNVYRDGELIGHTDVNNISNTTYTDGPLAYNMDGYTYYVTAVYDEGESAPTDVVTVKVSGYGNVDGHVYEQDGTTGIAGATVTMTGLDEFNVSHTYNFTTNAQGAYSGHIYAGSYNGQAAKEGYQTITEPVQGNPIAMVYNQTTSPVDYMLDENFNPVCSVLAEYYPDPEDINAPYVKVSWGCGLPGEEIIEPFETGDFSLFDWQVDATYPWTITTTDPYEGTYCMKSGGAGVANVVSNMSVTVNIPSDGLMSFFGKISCESSWDYGYFYIDGVQKGSYTGASAWSEKIFDITAGDHTFMWQYTKDGSVNSNDDCFYVDYITFYKQPAPPVPGMTYDFEDHTMQGWISVDADGDGRGWMVGSELMSGVNGHNSSSDFVFSQSYDNSWGVLYPDNYLVSPQVQLGGIVRFYACAQDANYAAEHFGVAVSTTNTNPSSFTMVQEWTMSAKSVGEGGKPVRNSRSGRDQGNWYEYTVDLSAYSGNGYVAIRHFNCSDMFYLDVDDITIGEPGKGIADNNRSLANYRIYRTNCYNDGPYTEENTVLLATNWPGDTIYIDVSWPDAAPGVYKWGVGVVYEGNRGEMVESPISWTAPVAVNRDAAADNDPNPVPGEDNGVRAPWDLMMTFTAPEGGHYGVAYDGNNFYTSNWGYSSAAHNFYKYDLSGNMLEGFEIAGCGTLRGMTYDGQYFYGVANSSTIYCVDLANHSVVSTFTSAYGAMRGITYDPVRDGFWVIGNWSGNLTLIDRTGAIQQVGPMPESASDLAYYMDENNVEHVFCFNNGDNGVYDYNITTNTLGGSVFNFSAVPGFDGGSSGGCTVGNFNGKMAFIGDIQQSPNLIGVYELRDGGGVGPTPGPGSDNLNQLALPRESETIWSNCLDKDMWLDVVDVTVLLNSADSPEGVAVTLTNLNEIEQAAYPVAPVTLNETGFFAWDHFRKGDYSVKVEFDGYEPIADTVSIWDETHLRYVMTEILYGVGNVYVSRTGWAMWDEANIPGGGGQGGSGSTFSVDFEGGMPEGWNVIDANNDGWTWCLTSAIPTTWTYYSSLSLDWYHGGTNAICSGSYINGVGALNPDEYFVSPQVTLAAGSQLSFWVAATDASYAADHFGVCVSDNGTSDWTMVQEWTLTGKKSGMMGGAASRDGEGFRLGTWYNYTVDLSAYAGQKYIAFRHFNCYDQYIMCLDDIELTSGAKDGDRHFEYYKVLCTSIDGVPIYNHNTVHPFCQLTTDGPYNAPLVEGDHYLCKVAVMYSTGMSAWSEPVEWEYEPCDHWGPVDEVTVGATTQGNHIEWVFEHGYNPYGGETPGPGPGEGDAFSVDFEGGLPAGWTVIDGNNDGWTWCLTSAIPTTWTYYASLSLDWYHSGTNAICSGSYINGVGALNPDEYLVSPQVTLAAGSQLSFWVAATDENYAADHFGVFVSDNGTSDWTSVQEWTLTGKKSGMAGGPASRDGNGLRIGNWYNYTVDLSAYAGQKYIAFRHFNCYDQYIMCLDDIELTAGAKGGMNFAKGGEFYTQYAEDGVMLNFYALDNVDLRAYLLYTLSNDSRFSLVPEEEYGQFVLTSDSMDEFETVYRNALADFSQLSKVDIADRIANWKNSVSPTNYLSIMMDVMMSKSRVDNDHCINSLPFCTSEVITFEAANTSNTANEPGMDDGCIGSSYNPSFYHMRIHTGGPFVIHMEGHDPNNGTDRDIDFCMWGPYTEQEVVSGTACSSLTGDKIMDCCYSASYSEDCYLGYTEGQHQHNTSHGDINYHMPEVGEYYILMITNYSQQPCVISFTKTEGEGETDCEIVNPDLIGFLITEDGEFVAFAGPDDREYTVEGEFGDHEYCVRPIYPGEMTLPDHNYGWSMGCPVCEFGPNGQGTCEPGAPIYGEALNETDQVKIWWGEQNPGPGGCEGDEFTLNFDNSQMPAGWTTLDADGDGFNWILGSACDGIYLSGGNLAGSGHNSSQDLIVSGSYSNVYGALTPDNWLISPAVTLCEGSTFSFWACGQDASYVAEHFGVAISDDGVNFGMVQEWTMTAKDNGVMSIGRNGQTRAQGSWHQYTVNLGDYAGEGRYIAIRHFSCTDMFILDVDDIELTNGAKNRANIVKYNVYRSDDNANYTLIGEVAAVAGQTYYEYIDTPATAGTYYYQVRADYGDCESEPAVSGENPDVNYVAVQTTGIEENSDNVALFPNPTTGNVTIQAQGMSRITVVSILGQVVYDTELNADEFTLNMGQFNAGLYMVRVYTESGMTVKRVTVMQ
ncbi:MAG: choice-of-anchor J domain-containing protein [Bacteroidales bacterium]|nr:choice-of-anchor J domain-containing protein [Bacteroidales bacterium]